MNGVRQWLQRQLARVQEARRQKNLTQLRQLQGRYQLFRGLLDSNTRAVALITELGVGLHDPILPPAGLRSRIGELLAVTEQMIEKLLRLAHPKYQGLARIHQQLANEISEILQTLPTVDSLPLCLDLAEAERNLLHAIGGKAARLADLSKNGAYGVPPGFVVPVHACRLFLDQEQLSLRLFGTLRQHLRLNPGEVPTHLIEETRREILAAPLPPQLEEALCRAGAPYFAADGPGLAVRSSAVGEDSPEHSFAGQYTTVLNVTTPKALLIAFKKVVASSFSARSLSYRLHAGLDPLSFDMAVLGLQMIPARASGILLTRDPSDSDATRMLISAVYGLGEAAVAGTSTADLYQPRRDGKPGPPPLIAVKDQCLVCGPAGGVLEEEVPAAERELPALPEAAREILCTWGLTLEKQEGQAQDIEWALDPNGTPHLLQARPLKMAGRASHQALPAIRPDRVLLEGLPTSGGRGTGRVFLARTRQDLEALPREPVILTLHQSLVDAARYLPEVRGVLVDFGNPADHLSCVAREYGIPMLTGLGTATASLITGEWVTVDAESGKVLNADEEEIRAAHCQPRPHRPAVAKISADPTAQALTRLRERIVPLHLTDAYGPTFSILECRSLHDIVRFVHEKAVITMFNLGDELLEQTSGTVYTLETQVPFSVSIIDLGGGLLPPARGRRITPPDVVSLPFRALWAGISDPRLRWGPPPGGVGLNSVMSRWLVDAGSERPIGLPNYLLLTRDYLNLNARMDFHFTMVDTVCDQDARSNYLKFRFKGGGTAPVQRHRRARCIAEILLACGFSAEVTDDLVNGDLQGVPQEIIEERLTMLGRLLGFTRLLDAAMRNEADPEQIAQAFLAGDYGLERLTVADQTAVSG